MESRRLGDPPAPAPAPPTSLLPHLAPPTPAHLPLSTTGRARHSYASQPSNGSTATLGPAEAEVAILHDSAPAKGSLPAKGHPEVEGAIQSACQANEIDEIQEVDEQPEEGNGHRLPGRRGSYTIAEEEFELEGGMVPHEGGGKSQEKEEEEEDHILSGLCLPRSQFFQTSIICSDTMTRDGLANERTFLAWLNMSMALCLVSFTFITRALTFDTLEDEINGGEHTIHKDRLSRWIGYVCFVAALLASVYSMLKYLRNIRRISTRYPFAQAGKWTFTIGLTLGTITMVALVLAYTTRI